MKNKTRTAKKLLALVLSLMMIVTALPMAVLPVSAAGEVTINTTSSTSGVVVIGGTSRWSNSTFNIVNDQEAGNTSAGIIQYDISSLRGKKITSAKFTAVVDSVDSDNQPTGFFYSTSAACATYVTSGGKETQNVGGNTGAGVIGCNSLLSKLGTTSSHKFGETKAAGTVEFDIKNAVQRLADGNVSTLYVIVAKTKAGGSGSSGGWTDTKVRPAAQRLYVTAADKPAAFTDTAYGSVDWTTPAITTVHGSFYNDNDNVTDAEYAQIYQNLIYAENAIGYDNAAAGTGIGSNKNSNDPFDGNDKVYGVRRIYYPTVVMLYDGQTTPKFGSMFLMDPNTKPWNWGWGNIRAFSAGFSGNQDALTFTGNWRGVDGGMNNQWNYISHGDSDVTSYDQSSGYYNTGSGDTRYFSNIITYQGSDFSASYKTITPSFFNRVGHDAGNSYMTYDSVKSVYVLNYKKALDKIAEMKSFMNSFNQNDWTIKSVNAFYTAINNLVQFNPSALKYSYASNTASAVRAAGNDMDSLIAAVDTAKANLRHGVTFVFTNGTTKVFEVADGGSVTAPANTATYIETSGNTHTRHTYSWNATATNVKTNLTISEVDTTESVPCNFVRTSTKTEQSCTDAEVAIFTCSNADGFAGCGATEERVVNPALGHDFTEKVIDEAHLKSAATCTAYAVYYYDCSRCDVMATDSDTNPTFEDTDAGYGTHKFDVQSTDAQYLASEATCTAKATYYYSCSVCGKKGTETFESGELAAHTLTHHEASAATCTVAGNSEYWECSVCSKLFSDANGTTETTLANVTIPATGAHTGGTATCQKKAVCEVCGQEYGEFGAHSLKAVAEVPATCGTAGVMAHYACTLCGAKFMDADGNTAATDADLAIAATGAHTWVYTTNGEADHTKTCSVCSATQTEAHTWVAGEVKTLATCTETGVQTYTCSLCNQEKDQTINALGHDFTEEIVDADHLRSAANCQYAATYWYDCSRCDVKSTDKYFFNGGKDASNHTGTFRDVAGQPATCYQDGWSDYRICNGCNQPVGYTVYKKTAHTFEATTSNNNGTHSQICSVCRDANRPVYTYTVDCTYTWVVDADATCGNGGTKHQECSVCGYKNGVTETIPATGEHTWDSGTVTPPTCTAEGYTTYECTVCGATKVEDKVAASGHSYVDVVTDPTCTEKGYTTHTCSVCDDSYVDTYVDALGHDIVNHDAKAPTCTEIGWDAYDTCSRCDYTTYVEKAALGHDIVNHDAQAPTCTEKGWDAYETCSRCDYTTYVELPSTGHTTATREENRVEASCGTDGSYDLVTYCSVCDEVLSTEHKTIPATGEHNYATEVEGTKTPATCVAEGSVTMSCGCGATKVVTLPIDSTNHANVVTDAAVAATCETTGLTKGSHCEACDTVIVAQTTVKATGHAWGEWTVEKAATCTEKGSEKRVCGNDASHVETRETEMAAHTEEILPAVEATCTATGLTEGKKCSVCGKILVAQTEVAMKDHTPAAAVQENVVPATCTAKGSYDSVVYCSVCNTELSRTKVDTDMIDHTPSDWIADGEASCATGGTKHKECTVCHTVLETGTIPATGVHTYVDVVTAPTCVAQGYTTHTCSVCGNSYVDSYVDALGHTEVADAAVDATCETAGKTAGKHCSVCGEVLVAQTEIPALGHDYDDGVLTRPAVVDGAWVDGYYTYTCKNDASHTYTETAPRANYTEYDKLVSDINDAIANGNLTQDAIDALNAALADNAVADNLIDSEQATVDAAASALKNALDAADGALKPDFTAIDKALDEYDDADAAVVVPDEVANRIDEIKDIINDIKNDPNATRADKQDDIDALVDEVNGYVSHLAECAKGNHEYEAGWTIDIEATCAHSGWKSHHCAYCGSTTARPEYDADGVEIAKLAHSVTSWTETKAPTCTAEGEKTGTCDLCGTAVTEAVAKLGHNWSAWTRTKNSTCIEKGKETRTCDRCGEVQTRELPLVGHHIVTLPGVDATCDEPGKTDGEYCDVCGLVTKEQKEIPARGHLDMDGDGKCDACDCDYDGECECMCHNDSLWSRIVRFIYTLFSKIFRKRIACCEDMVFWGGEIKDLT